MAFSWDNPSWNFNFNNDHFFNSDNQNIFGSNKDKKTNPNPNSNLFTNNDKNSTLPWNFNISDQSQMNDSKKKKNNDKMEINNYNNDKMEINHYNNDKNNKENTNFFLNHNNGKVNDFFHFHGDKFFNDKSNGNNDFKLDNDRNSNGAFKFKDNDTNATTSDNFYSFFNNNNPDKNLNNPNINPFNNPTTNNHNNDWFNNSSNLNYNDKVNSNFGSTSVLTNPENDIKFIYPNNNNQNNNQNNNNQNNNNQNNNNNKNDMNFTSTNYNGLNFGNSNSSNNFNENKNMNNLRDVKNNPIINNDKEHNQENNNGNNKLNRNVSTFTVDIGSNEVQGRNFDTNNNNELNFGFNNSNEFNFGRNGQFNFGFTHTNKSDLFEGFDKKPYQIDINTSLDKLKDPDYNVASCEANQFLSRISKHSSTSIVHLPTEKNSLQMKKTVAKRQNNDINTRKTDNCPKLTIPKDCVYNASYYLEQIEKNTNKKNTQNIHDETKHDNNAEKKNNKKQSNPNCPILTQKYYYTIPSIDDLQQLDDFQLSQIENFAIGHEKFGKITWIGETDVRGLNLDELVTFGLKSVEVYKDGSSDDVHKPQQGHGLNKKALIELYNIWPNCPKNYNGDRENYDPKNDHEALKQYSHKLMKYCSKKNGVEFKEYDMTNGKWVFTVEHFTVYGYDDKEEEDMDV